MVRCHYLPTSAALRMLVVSLKIARPRKRLPLIHRLPAFLKTCSLSIGNKRPSLTCHGQRLLKCVTITFAPKNTSTNGLPCVHARIAFRTASLVLDRKVLLAIAQLHCRQLCNHCHISDCMSSEPLGQLGIGFKREFGPSKLRSWLRTDGAAGTLAR